MSMLRRPTDLVRFLLDSDPKLNIDYHTTNTEWDPSSSTALHHTIAFGSDAIVEMLLNHGAKVDIPDYGKDTVVHLASQGVWRPSTAAEVTKRHRVHRILELLLAQKPNLTVRNNYGCTPLHSAGDNATMKPLLEDGAPVNTPDENGNTVPHHAMSNRTRSTARVLLEYGADPAVKNLKRGLAPLHLAAANGYHCVVSTLIEFGVDVNVEEKEGLAPVDYTRTVGWTESRGSYTRMVELLLRASGLPGLECRAIANERHQGDKAAYDNASAANVARFMEEFGLA